MSLTDECGAAWSWESDLTSCHVTDIDCDNDIQARERRTINTVRQNCDVRHFYLSSVVLLCIFSLRAVYNEYRTLYSTSLIANSYLPGFKRSKSFFVVIHSLQSMCRKSSLSQQVNSISKYVDPIPIATPTRLSAYIDGYKSWSEFHTFSLRADVQ